MKTKTLQRIAAVLFVLLSFSIFCKPAIAQVPEIIWQKVIGGFEPDYMHTITATADGGHLCSGWSESGIGGDKTEAFIGGFLYGDYWVVKLDSNRNIQWQKTLGGTGDEHHEETIVTSDGGYLVAGYSSSPASGNKTEGNLTTDYWLVKLDASGNISWQNTIGGNLSDILYCIDELADGSYIVCGQSSSDISGDKTEARIGTNDIWILKLNNAGNILWQKTLGGSGQEFPPDVLHTSDGGFIIAGTSDSGISGNKTMAGYGGYDYWIVKFDAAGNIEWQKGYGGDKNDLASCVLETTDGKFIVSGKSGSGISGVKTEPSFDFYASYSDIWILKLDENGNLLGQNTIGTGADENVMDMQNMPDGGFLLSAATGSVISGDLTEATNGGIDVWVLKFDIYGNIVWQNTIGGLSNDVGSSLLVEDDGYVIGGFSGSVISGDKTIAPVGANDYWLFKLGSECFLGNEICNGVDDDCNSLIDEDLNTTFSIYAAGETSFCQGETGKLVANYPGSALQWKRNGVPVAGAIYTEYYPSVKGTYTCVATNDCDTLISNPIIIHVNKNPPASITAGGPITFCAGGSVVLSANAGSGLTYKWYKGNSVISGATSITYTATTAGKYKCRVTKTATGCYQESNIIKVTINCREGEFPVQNIDVYPNPANDYFIVSGSDMTGPVTLQIFNQTGRLLHTETVTENEGSFIADIDALKDAPSGVYLIYVSGSDTFSVHELVLE